MFSKAVPSCPAPEKGGKVLANGGNVASVDERDDRSLRGKGLLKDWKRGEKGGRRLLVSACCGQRKKFPLFILEKGAEWPPPQKSTLGNKKGRGKM